ncbi:glycosyltransferase [Hymenobacter busanensis]|uniref:Glycosyltransferase n=1 Tax=Hymenobacter busanensis TaxID=2607656 RepID=A0A7L4ZZG1_9BACT|nr:glycosyltransferase [Hymenobacter busanensis]KAA9333089.1 glycosyltransferase [Hymenobacter busanensis]QHJ08236.1 glycosyltransferase [Hymenobacter busanensis]
MVFFALFFAFFFLTCSGLLVCALFRSQPHVSQARPRVSILVPARNEAHHIERCLQSLARLSYPPELLEILIGDDASTDDTAAVVQAFIADKPPFRLVRIGHPVGSARGKSNAIAQLCRQATADYFLLTDADMQLPPDWVQHMLGAAEAPAHGRPVGVVTGSTVAHGNLFGRLQGLDWLFGLSVIRVLSDGGLPVTAVGNNMLVTRAAYDSIGGYETLAFQITEDLQLFACIVQAGWGYRNLWHGHVLGISAPQPTVRCLLEQRKRWMRGTTRLPWYLSGLFGLYGVFYMVLFFPPWVAWPLTPLLYGAKVLLQTLYLWISLRQVGRHESLGVLLLYEFYLAGMSLLVLGYTLWPGHIRWKERRYAWAEV